ncbi:Uncharacterized protein DAT39_023430 [Clarias magur]|uniref:Uncharacterized protein n=1 Tax=Clarias magur TaxID=1594786 RepID=A0A8J4WMT7_CLAMG|nr:Uncharacterized protein DAT39_023430 [Clarias magur]
MRHRPGTDEAQTRHRRGTGCRSKGRSPAGPRAHRGQEQKTQSGGVTAGSGVQRSRAQAALSLSLLHNGRALSGAEGGAPEAICTKTRKFTKPVRSD